MKLLIIAGFLGSGKTTLLLEVAKRLAAVSQRIAIIENEVGVLIDEHSYRLR
jgi:G3E family GTPase